MQCESDPYPAKTDAKDNQSPLIVNDVNTPSQITPAYSGDFESSANSAPTQPQSPKPVPFSSIVGVGKVSPEVMEKCHRDGVEFDLKLQHEKPEVEIELLDDVDIEAEKKKAESCIYWPDREEFLSKFNFKDIEDSLLPRIHDLLWSFRHCFFNEQFPEQFRQGIKMKPVVVNALPGKSPKKEKIRQMSDEKLSHLKKHIDTMVAQGVLEELTDVVDCHASPLHIVIEKRFVASKNTVVEKSRCTADLRGKNVHVPGGDRGVSSFPQYKM